MHAEVFVDLLSSLVDRFATCALCLEPLYRGPGASHWGHLRRGGLSRCASRMQHRIALPGQAAAVPLPDGFVPDAGWVLAMVRRLQQWDRGAGFAAIRHDWLARAGGIGEPVRVRIGDDHLEGIFAAIDPTGRLLLAVSDGTTRVIGAGEVVRVR